MKRVLIFLMVLILSVFCACNTKTGSTSGESESESVEINSEESKTSTSVKIFSVTIQVSQVGGSVVADKTTVRWDESVTFTVTIEEGYQLEYFKINGIDVALDENNQCVVSRPVSDIVVTAKFSAVIGEDSIVYVSSENAPVIDGEFDDVWRSIPALYTANVYNHNTQKAFSEEFAYLKVMWNEEGMYFLGVVFDSEILESDRFNIWFSEVYTTQDKDYSSNANDGNYAICINPYAENLVYTNLDVADFWTAASDISDGAYIVEVFIPVLGETPLQENTMVGLDVSVDYFTRNGSIDSDRDYYANWYGASNYWSNVGALKPMKLIKK